MSARGARGRQRGRGVQDRTPDDVLGESIAYGLRKAPDGLTSAALATALGEPKAVVERVLRRLQAAGAVERTTGLMTWHLTGGIGQ